NRVVSGVPVTETAIRRVPLRKTIVSIEERKIANDNIRATADNICGTADIEPRTSYNGILAYPYDRCVGSDSDPNACLLRLLGSYASILKWPTRNHRSTPHSRIIGGQV